ncbi:hypothetical protein D3C78_1897680 [compost metagenome]
MEAAISESQTFEMKSHCLQLVVPEKIQATYSDSQRDWLIGLEDFIELAKS